MVNASPILRRAGRIDAAVLALLPDMDSTSGRTLRALLVLFALFTAWLVAFASFA